MPPPRTLPATATLGILLLGACTTQSVSESQPAAGASAPRPEPVARDPRELPRIDCGTVIKARVVTLTKRGWLTSAQDAELEILDVLWVGPHYDRPFERALGLGVGSFLDAVMSRADIHPKGLEWIGKPRRPVVGERINAPSTGRCWPWHEKWPESFWFAYQPWRPFTLTVGSDYWVAIKSLAFSDAPPRVIAAAHPAQ